MKKVTIAGPIIIPQKPNVESPATIEKNISSSFIEVGFFTTFLLIQPDVYIIYIYIYMYI